MREICAFLDDLSQEYVQENFVEHDEDSIITFLHKLKNIMNPFYERGDTTFYSSKDINQFCDFFSKEDILQHKYLTSLKEMLYEILENALDWTSTPQNESDSNYYRWEICNEVANPINSTVLAEITERVLKKPNRNFVLVLPPHYSHPYKCRNFISCFKDRQHKPEELPKFVKIAYVEDDSMVRDCILRYRQPLIMNKNNKHGENGKDEHKSNKGNKVSKLYCSIAEAQELLNTAIGDIRIKEDRLYNFDREHGKFIVFYYEKGNSENHYQYHAFHLNTEQEINEQRVSPIFKRLKEKFQLR